MSRQPSCPELPPEASPASRSKSGMRPALRLVRRAANPVVGETLAGRYLVTSLIGCGGMGIVYAATDLATGAEVALKALTPSAYTPANVCRLRIEAEAAASVNHQHLCRVHYLGVERGTPFIVMERLHGETVSQRLKETGPLSVVDAITILGQILDGLSAAHAAGILHRDIKPGNVFITTARGETPFIKIIDFGVAKLMAAESREPEAAPESGVGESVGVTRADKIPGTPSYLSPEQLGGGRDLDARIDVWAAGLTFFEMLMGRRAYCGDSFARLACAIRSDPVPSVSAMRSDLPASFDRVLATALRKQRRERYATAAQFRAAVLDAWVASRAAGKGRPDELRAEVSRLQALDALHDELDDDDDVDETTDIDIRIDVELES